MLNKKYDVIINGSSPLHLALAIKNLHQKKSVLLLEERSCLGGAWYTSNVWDLKNLEVGCHILKNKSQGYKILEGINIPLHCMNPQPGIIINAPRGLSFFNSSLNTLFYLVSKITGKTVFSRFSYDQLRGIKHTTDKKTKFLYLENGCGELVQGLTKQITQLGGTIISNTKIESVNLTAEQLRIQTNSENVIETERLILSKNFNIKSIVIDKQVINPIKKVLIGEHYVLRLNGKKAQNFSFLHVLEHPRINLISDTGMWNKGKKPAELIICISVKSNTGVQENNLVINSIDDQPTAQLQQKEANYLLNELKRKNLLTNETTLIDFLYEPYPIYVKHQDKLEEVVTKAKPNIQLVNSTDLVDSLIEYC